MVGLVRIRAEQHYGNPAGSNEWPPAAHVLVDSPPEIAETIADWYRRRGWEVNSEPI